MGIIKKLKWFLKRIKFTLQSQRIKDSWRDLTPCDVLLMAHENDRSYQFEGLSYSHIIDTVGWYLSNSNHNISIQSLTLPFSNTRQDCAFGLPKSINRSMLFAKLKWKLFGRLFQANKMSENPELKLWLHVLALTNPKVVIAIQPHPILCQACRMNNVQVFDYQHGLINETMPEYGQSFVARVSKQNLPTGYLCWDEESANVVREWAASKEVHVFVHGNPWMNRFMNRQQNDSLVMTEIEKLQNSINQVMANKLYEKVVLVTLQPGLDCLYPQSFNSNQFVHKALIEVLESSPDDILWLIRLHPIQFKDPGLKNRIIRLFSKFKNVEVIHATISALPAVLSYVNGHVTWNSCVVLEAANMGVHSFIMEPHQANSLENESLPFFSHIEKRNLATRAKHDDCVEEMKVWLHSIGMNRDHINLAQFDVESFIRDIGITQN